MLRRVRPTICAMAALLLTSCASQESALRAWTAGRVACGPQEIQVRDVQSSEATGLMSWTAVCRDREYYCAKSFGSFAEHMASTERSAEASAPAHCTPSSEALGASSSSSEMGDTIELATLSAKKGVSGTELLAHVGVPNRFAAVFGFPDGVPQRLRIGVLASSSEPRYAQCRSINAVVDGKPMTIVAAAHYSRRAPAESLSGDVTLETIAAIANAKASTVLACSDSIQLTERHLATLRAFLTRWEQIAPKGGAQPSAAPDAATSEPHAEPVVQAPGSEAQPESPLVAPPSTGCQHDMQCKGDRICRDGQCVDPTPATKPRAGSVP
jgi:hypothetical protein